MLRMRYYRSSRAAYYGTRIPILYLAFRYPHTYSDSFLPLGLFFFACSPQKKKNMYLSFNALLPPRRGRPHTAHTHSLVPVTPFNAHTPHTFAMPLLPSADRIHTLQQRPIYVIPTWLQLIAFFARILCPAAATALLRTRCTRTCTALPLAPLPTLPWAQVYHSMQTMEGQVFPVSGRLGTL